MSAKMEIRIRILVLGLALLVAALLSTKVGAACTADTRTNVSANNVLTSTKYNADLNTLYTRLNGNLDGGCIASDSIESGALQANSVDRDNIADGTLGGGIDSTSGNITITATNDFLTISASSGDVTVTLPTAAGITGKRYFFSKSDTSDNIVTIDADGSETINGATTDTLFYQYAFSEIISDGTNWVKLSDDYKRCSFSIDLGTTTVSREIGNCVASIANDIVGRDTVTWETGYWSQEPDCSVTCLDANSFHGYGQAGGTTTSKFGCYNASATHANADAELSVICHGK